MQKKTVKTAAAKTSKKAAVKDSENKKTETKKKACVKAAPAVKKEAKPKTTAKKSTSVKAEKTKETENLDMESIIADLEEQRRDILESIETKENLDLESGSGGDEADIAARNLNNEMLYELSSNDRIRVRDIEAALTKIKKGTYGICEHCKKPIEKKRLKFMPYVRYCVACQNGTEASRRNVE